jgi:hypothetical protein
MVSSQVGGLASPHTLALSLECTDSVRFGAMRFKSSDSIIRNNSVHNEGCRVNSHGGVVCATASLEVSYLQPWFEGAAFIENVTIKYNRRYLGAGVNPLYNQHGFGLQRTV